MSTLPPHQTERRQRKRVQVDRRPEVFASDDTRVILRFFSAGDEARIQRIIDRVLRLPEPTVQALLDRVYQDFSARHQGLDPELERHFDQVRHFVEYPDSLSSARRRLIGAYFTMEYAIESAALFNPSIVPHPNQDGLEDPGDLRFLMSLRATGEGHVSSIVFRTGVAHADGSLTFDPAHPHVAPLKQKTDKTFDRQLFFYKLIEMGAWTDACQPILDALPDPFPISELSHVISETTEAAEDKSAAADAGENMLWLARSNYTLVVPEHADPSSLVIFPASENESRGIEDVRLTRFVEDNGEVTFFGTYTAYNGFRILPQIIETKDFHTIEVHTLNGRYVQNKGMAMFPRRVNGQYAMIGRLDGENLFYLTSDNVHFWNEAAQLQQPAYPWEFVQIGNCGPPIETEAGWLLLTHGVGAMRKYCIGVSLLDLHDPSQVIGHLPDPLIVPNEEERDGYVPNVVYSCGGLILNDTLLIPYAMSDVASRFATVHVPELLAALANGGKLSL